MIRAIRPVQEFAIFACILRATAISAFLSHLAHCSPIIRLRSGGPLPEYDSLLHRMRSFLRASRYLRYDKAGPYTFSSRQLVCAESAQR